MLVIVLVHRCCSWVGQFDCFPPMEVCMVFSETGSQTTGKRLSGQIQSPKACVLSVWCLQQLGPSLNPWKTNTNTGHVTILPKAIYKFNTIQTKTSTTFFTKTRKSKIHMEPEKTWIAKSVLAKNKNTGGTAILDYKIYYRATIISTIWNQHKNRYVDRWNKQKTQTRVLITTATWQVTKR